MKKPAEENYCPTSQGSARQRGQVRATLLFDKMRRRFLVLAISLFVGNVCVAQSDMPSADSGSLDFKQWGLLAIQDGGRRKPIDTFARETLIKTTGRSSYTDTRGKTWQANDFILSMLLDTHDWKSEPMILVSLGQLNEKLGLDKTERRFSFTQLTSLPELNVLAAEAHALRKAEKPLDRLQNEVMSVSERLAVFAHVMDGSAFLLVPAREKTTDAWLVPPEFGRYYEELQFASAQTQLQTLATAYAKGDGFQFSRAANQLRDDLRGLSPKIYPKESQLRLEYFYNHWDGFYRAAWCYGIALVLLIIAYARRGPDAAHPPSPRFGAASRAAATAVAASLREASGGKQGILQGIGVVLAIAGLLFHASGIAMRCLIGGRPPVTNMYESIIWVSFAVSFFGMIFFARYRTPVYLRAALPVSFVALLLVHQMPIAMPSSIDPLVPVLRDNFWLTIHVLTITLSYAAFALAMGFGHILLWRYARDPVAARLPSAPVGRDPVGSGHNSRWRLGELFLGTILGLGPEGDLGPHRAALLHLDLARPASGLVDTIWIGRGERCLFSGGLDGLVWREFRARERIAQLRVWPWRRNVRRQLCHC